jgi:carboxymethylenebutenolidase
MLKLNFVAVFLAAGTLVWPTWQAATTRASDTSTRPPTVTADDAPGETETLPVNWIRVDAAELGAMRAAVARPSGTGPFPAVLLLHGTHGFARQYVEWAYDLARGGFIVVAACWFSGGGGADFDKVTPIPCPEVPPLGSGEYPRAVQLVDALVQATRRLPGVRADRIALVGHSRGAGATQQYLLAKGNVQAAVLHSSGYALRPWQRAEEFNAPLLIMHGTGDTFGENTRFTLAREFEKSLRAHDKRVETAYCEGCGHNTFFTNPTQRHDELKKMIAFLHRHLGRSPRPD